MQTCAPGDTLFSTSVFADQARRAAIDAMLRAGLRTDREVALRELHSQLAAGLNEEDAEGEEDEDAPTARLRGRTRQWMVDDMARFSRSQSASESLTDDGEGRSRPAGSLVST